MQYIWFQLLRLRRISSTWHETLQLNVKYILADIDMSMSDGGKYHSTFWLLIFIKYRNIKALEPQVQITLLF